MVSVPKHSSLDSFIGALLPFVLLSVLIGTLTGCGSRNTQATDTAPASVSVPAVTRPATFRHLPMLPLPARLPEKPHPTFPTTHITGVVAAANAHGLVLSAHKITFPNGKTIPLNPARPKRLLLAPGTALPAHLKVGSPLTAVGYDTGVGKPLKTFSLNTSPQVAAAAAKTYTADPAHGAFLAKLSSLSEGSVSAPRGKGFPGFTGLWGKSKQQVIALLGKPSLDEPSEVGGGLYYAGLVGTKYLCVGIGHDHVTQMNGVYAQKPNNAQLQRFLGVSGAIKFSGWHKETLGPETFFTSPAGDYMEANYQRLFHTSDKLKQYTGGSISIESSRNDFDSTAARFGAKIGDYSVSQPG